MDFRFSQTSDYMLCRRKYTLGYIHEREHIPYDDRPGSAAETGTIGHAGLAAYYRGEGREGALNAAASEASRLGLSGHAADTAAKAAVQRYVDWHQRTDPDAGWAPILVEERLRAKLGTFHGVDVYLTGQADLVMEDDFGSLHIVDHKFTASFAYQAGTIELNRQGLTYAWLAMQHFGRPIETFTLNLVLRKILKKDPGLIVDRISVYIDEEQLARHVEYLCVIAEEMVRLHLEVEQGDERKAFLNPGNWCSWCPFRNVCPLMDTDPAAAQVELETKFRKKAPL